MKKHFNSRTSNIIQPSSSTTTDIQQNLKEREVNQFWKNGYKRELIIPSMRYLYNSYKDFGYRTVKKFRLSSMENFKASKAIFSAILLKMTIITVVINLIRLLFHQRPSKSLWKCSVIQIICIGHIIPLSWWTFLWMDIQKRPAINYWTGWQINHWNI